MPRTIWMPLSELPEMTLPAHGVRPPIVLPETSLMNTPFRALPNPRWCL